MNEVDTKIIENAIDMAQKEQDRENWDLMEKYLEWAVDFEQNAIRLEKEREQGIFRKGRMDHLLKRL